MELCIEHDKLKELFEEYKRLNPPLKQPPQKLIKLIDDSDDDG